MNIIFFNNIKNFYKNKKYIFRLYKLIKIFFFDEIIS